MAEPSPSFVHLPIDLDDLDAVLEIEKTAFPFPWSRAIFQRELTYDWAHLIGRFEPSAHRLVAYVNYWLVYDEVHVMNVAVHAEHRRAGHGAALLEHVLSFARMHQCATVTLEVRRSNVAAQALYRRFSFEDVGVRPRYYIENGEDAIVMTLALGEGR
jgi:ribosomal-protein-alanine N-acetyltransferase